MALYDRPHDRRYDYSRQPRTFDSWGSSAMPLIFAAAVVLALMALFYAFGDRTQVGDTNSGPSVRTVTPSTSPAVPGPNPTTQPRPTPAPVP